jgi:predicted AAA+ superfamily ATPase
VYHLFPFSFLELGEKFQLSEALHWGMLPRIIHLDTSEEKLRFLQAYAQTYLKEEIWHEQLIRNLDPFRRFLEVSAQCNGKIINYKNIADDVGVDDKTVKNYFNLLEDTLVGFFLEPFQHSFRKRLSQKPKFYYFDTGVVRSLTRTLSLPLKPGTSAYGDVFEQFVIIESLKAANYYQPEFRFSYLKTKDDAEIDLVVERPGLPVLLIEIKSNTHIKPHDLSSFIRLSQDFPNAEVVCFSNDPHPKQIAHITVLAWQEGIKKYFVKM